MGKAKRVRREIAIAMRRMDWQQAAHLLDMAIRQMPNADLHQARALIGWISNDTAWALWHAREATAISLEAWAPCAPALCLYGQIAAFSSLSSQTAEASNLYLEEALNCFQMALRQSPSDPKLLSCEAFSLFRLKRYSEALTAASECLVMYEGFPKPPHVQRLKSALERARTGLHHTGPWFRRQLVQWMSQEIACKGILMWHSSDLLVALPAFLGEARDDCSSIVHGRQEQADMLQQIGTRCISPPDLRSALQLLDIELPLRRHHRRTHTLCSTIGDASVISPSEEPDPSLHLSAFLRSAGNQKAYDAVLRLSKRASQQAARKQMLERVLAAQPRPHVSLTPALQTDLQHCLGWGPVHEASKYHSELQAIQQFLATHHLARMERLHVAMLAPDSVIVSGSKACDDHQLYFQSPTHGLMELVGPPVPSYLQEAVALRFIQAALLPPQQQQQQQAQCKTAENERLRVGMDKARQLVGLRRARRLLELASSRHCQADSSAQRRLRRHTAHEQPYACANPEKQGPLRRPKRPNCHCFNPDDQNLAQSRCKVHPSSEDAYEDAYPRRSSTAIVPTEKPCAFWGPEYPGSLCCSKSQGAGFLTCVPNKANSGTPDACFLSNAWTIHLLSTQFRLCVLIGMFRRMLGSLTEQWHPVCAGQKPTADGTRPCKAMQVKLCKSRTKSASMSRCDMDGKGPRTSGHDVEEGVIWPRPSA